MYKKLLIFNLMLLMQCGLAFAQNNIVQVDHLTGTANVQIPLFSIKNGNISVPVSLVYSGKGIKPKDIEGTAGMGWDLDAGGTITREVRGLPDDSKKDLAGNDRLGWIYNNNGTKISNFSIANDNNSSTCADETADLNYINSNFSDFSDTEPDIFFVNAPGLSCRLIFDNNHTIRTIPYMDIKTSYATDTNGSIQSFTIVNDQGTEYLFSFPDVITRSATSANEGAISFFKKDFNFYKNKVRYNNTWKLNSIKDACNNVTYFDYLVLLGDGGVVNVESRDSIYTITGGQQPSYSRTLQYVMTETYQRYFLTMVSYVSAFGWHTWELSYLRSKPIIDQIKCPERIINFTYGISSGNTEKSKRSFLTKISMDGCAAPTLYSFDYYGRDGNNYIPLADSSSREVDAWGYYNASRASSLVPAVYINPSDPFAERYRSISPGSNTSYSLQISGSNRAPNATAAIMGSLSKIIYPEGGYTTLGYELNDYYDPVAGGVVQGGGIRIREIKDYDVLTDSVSTVRTFSYADPTSGLSSGKPVGMPQLAFTRPYTGGGSTSDQWSNSTVRLEEDLSSEGKGIMYSHVKESISGAGWTTYEYATPATFWDNSAAPDWAPTWVYHARPSCTPAGFLLNGKNIYPFAPNPNFDFERGLLKKTAGYKDNGQKLSETVFSYQRTGSPMIITGLKFDDNAGIMAYSKYNLLTAVGELRTQEITRNYDVATGQEQVSTVNYSYNGIGHKLPTKIASIASDGLISRTAIRYTKDYPVPAGGTAPLATAIRKLQEQNVNLPVESIVQREENGQNRTISAKLFRYGEFNPSGSNPFYMPSEQLNFSSADGVTDFIPSTFASGTISNDPRYQIVQRYLSYDVRGNVQTSEDIGRNLSTVLTDGRSQQVVATISGARVKEIALNDFESDVQPVNRFVKAGDYTYVAGRSGNNAVSVSPSDVFTTTVDKSVRASNYIFSAWIKTTTGGALTFSLTSTGQTQVLPYSTGDWKYYELKVPVTAAPSSFSVQVQSNQAIQIDDILFYPENAEVMSATYHPSSFVKTSETNANGVSTYYSYDDWGRLRLVFDQDKNILTKKSYYGKEVLESFNNPIYIASSPSEKIYTGTPVSFFADYVCGPASEGLVYTWDYGDGSPVVSTQTYSSPSHVYTSKGEYIVKVTIASPLGESRSDTAKFKVEVNSPLNVNVVIHSNVTSGYISSVVFYKDGKIEGSMPATLDQPYLIKPGVYDMKITYKGHSTFKSIKVNNDLATDCFSIGSASSSIMVFLDAESSTLISITADNQQCQWP
ncbi:PKD domain-containing protein [Arcticibacter tournemirensis]